MYSDNTFDNLFTGYESGGEYIYPTAAQNLVLIELSVLPSAAEMYS